MKRSLTMSLVLNNQTQFAIKSLSIQEDKPKVSFHTITESYQAIPIQDGKSCEQLIHLC